MSPETDLTWIDAETSLASILVLDKTRHAGHFALHTGTFNCRTNTHTSVIYRESNAK